MTTSVAQHAAELLDAFCGPLRTRAATPADALTIEPARELLDADSATRAEALIQAIELLCPPKGWLTRLGLGKARNVGQERELIVTAKDGQRYRIHLGSASVRRAADGDGGEDARQTSASERVDVPLDRRAKRQLDEVFLPFEGDSMLKTILAKAFALAG